ncbi:NB-ARC domain, LRR domain containing protein [Parasponia andersonii]|uniref:NB-ARC domain, LRR domain containing protein n=1 Tax=Parasponia andersonii TaxID=3476 RepID=A0A2P5AAA5_PARAD|nr:NB-ARC domain, LRR domain containing protein [Parasponia andersonii]
MAETVVFSILTEAIVSEAIQRISVLLIDEATSLISVTGDVEYLRNELRRMQGFLKRAACTSKHEHDEYVHIWLAELREVACEIEDALEIYIVKMDSSYVKAFHLRSLQKRINSIKKKIKDIFESKDKYEIKLGSVEPGEASTSGAEPMRSDPVYDDEEGDDLVGMDHRASILKIQLMEEKGNHLCVVPIVGMGGLGKTTLAKKVYNDSEVKQYFDCCVWVLISQEYVPRHVFSEILIQVGFFRSQRAINDSEKRKQKAEMLEEMKKEREILKTMKESDLITFIKNELKGKRFLVVLDDIWRKDDWDSIRKIFPNEKMGSRVVFTTRSKDVALHADQNNLTIEPPLLTLEESLRLLHRRAFPREHCCPTEFEGMGKEMVEKCGGLPLAIVVLGGILRTKTSTDERKKVKRDVNSHLSKNGVQQMLALSYHDLPYYLKLCFLYLGNFPKDMEIPRKKLIHLWIAEGLIVTGSTTRRQTMEEIAEEYLRELIDRCMVQVEKKDYKGSGVKTCRMHDLMRDFCVSKAREDDFFEVIQPEDQKHRPMVSCFPTEHTSTTQRRRIALHPGCDFDTSQMHPHLRSLLCFDVSPLSLVHILRSKNLRLLRVLDFGFTERARKCNVPTEIGSLILLRYLGLRNARKVKLPCSIGNLRSLGTIDLRDNDEVALPAEILRLTRLEHLLLPFDTCFSHSFSWGIHLLSDTTHIQTLKYIRFGPLLLKHKMVRSELTRLQNLGVQFKSNEEVRQLFTSPNFDLKKLQSLHMLLLSVDAFTSLQPLSECIILSKLFLDGKISDKNVDCPGHHNLESLPTSLTKLILTDSSLREDPMAALEKLPNLSFLRLHNSYSGSEMVCSQGSFRKLETLQLVSLKKVTEWRVELGSIIAMRNLKRLHIKHMPELRMIPEGLRCITTLRELKISEMRRSFEDRLRVSDGIEGVDFGKVRLVSSISFSSTLPSI